MFVNDKFIVCAVLISTALIFKLILSVLAPLPAVQLNFCEGVFGVCVQ
jgi:hypothetical protein